MSGIFVSGIGTEVGKTVVSCLLLSLLKAEYWKPVQAGDLDNSDSNFVKKILPEVVVHDERYRLSQPMSPHAAAKIDNVHIDLDQINLPVSHSQLVVEGAGGLLVPLNDHQTMLDLIKKLKLPVVLVSRNYLGSINHTLLSIEALRNSNLNLLGLIFSGVENKESQEIILKQSGVRFLGRLEHSDKINEEFIKRQALNFSSVDFEV